MARTVTPNAIKRIMTKGLSGWEAGRLILQDSIDLSCGIAPTLTDADMAAIRSAPLKGKDVRDFNTIMALARAFEKGVAVSEMAWKDACLDLAFLVKLLEDANKRSTVELFSSFGPHVVSRKQYEDIVAAQRERKLAFEYSLGYVVEEHFYTLSPEAKREVDGLCIDLESTEEFVAAVQEKYSDLCEKAFEEIRGLYCSGKLKITYPEEDGKAVKPLLARWRKGELALKKVAKLLDMVYVTGQQLYKCRALREWKAYIDQYQQYVHGDEDERFRYVYAVVEDCPARWLDENGCYRDPSPPSGWITSHTEHALGLRAMDDGDEVRTVEEVGAVLGVILGRVEYNIRLFYALKAILEAALEAADLNSRGDAALTAQGRERLRPYLEEYHHRLTRVKTKPRLPEVRATKLEEVLRMLPAIDLEKLRPTEESNKALEDSVLSDLMNDAWFKTKLGSLEYTDGFRFDTWLN